MLVEPASDDEISDKVARACAVTAQQTCFFRCCPTCLAASAMLDVSNHSTERERESLRNRSIAPHLPSKFPGAQEIAM